MTTPRIKLVGLGTAGASILDWSRLHRNHAVSYLALDTDHVELARSTSPKKFGIGDLRYSKHQGARLQRENADAFLKELEGSDACIIIGGLGGLSAGCLIPDLVRIARRAGIHSIAIPIIPALREGPEKRELAAESMALLYELNCVVAPFQLDRIDLDAVLGNKQELAEATEHVYAWIDRWIELISAARSIDPLAGALFSTPDQTALADFRRIRFDPAKGTAIIDLLKQDEWFLGGEFASAKSALAIFRGGTALQPEFARATHALRQFLGRDCVIDCLVRTDSHLPDCGMIDIFATGPSPSDFGKIFASYNHAESGYLPVMPWLDQAPATAMNTSFTGLFGRVVQSQAKTEAPSRGPAKTSVADRAVTISRKVAGVLPKTSKQGMVQFPEGSWFAWLDHKADQLEQAFIESGKRLGQWLDANQRDPLAEPPQAYEALSPLFRLPSALFASEGKNRRRWATSIVACVGLIVATSALMIGVFSSIGRAQRISDVDAAKIRVTREFAEADQERISDASNNAPMTLDNFDNLGLASTYPSALVARLDWDAPESSYYRLSELSSLSPPFKTFASQSDEADGQLRVMGQELHKLNPSVGKALYSLGIFPEIERMAELTGANEARLAIGVSRILRSDNGAEDLASSAARIGCSSLSRAVDQQFQLKRYSPSRINIPVSYYLFELARADGAECEEAISLANQAERYIGELTSVAYLRRVDDQSDNPRFADYRIIIESSIAAESGFSGALRDYLFGLKSFYLLDFPTAETAFRQLSGSSVQEISALGQLLEARTIFWSHQFLIGAYRPDRFAPWRHFETSDRAYRNIDTTARDAWSEGLISRCSPEGSSELCLYSRISQRLTTGQQELAPQRLETLVQIRKNLNSVPLINPEYIDRYLEIVSAGLNGELED